jgi:AraC family transcriptional regulator
MRPDGEDIRTNEYLIRLNRCIDYIHNHYGDPLNLTRLAEVACFSRFHFHRIFRALIGETVNDFVQRVRLEKATSRLILERDQSITDIALATGFSSSQNFARRFKAYYGVTPSQVRAKYNWNAWTAHLNAMKTGPVGASAHELGLLRPEDVSWEALRSNTESMQVTIQSMPACRTAYVRTRGPYRVDDIRAAFNRLLQWARPKGLMDQQPRVMGVFWNSTRITPQEKMIFDACIAVPPTIQADAWVNIQTIKGGIFAVHRAHVENDRHEETWMRLMLNWLVSSDYQPDDRPAYEIYYSNPDIAPDGRAWIDLCLPVKPLKG